MSLKRTIGIFSHEELSILSEEELSKRNKLKNEVFNVLCYDLQASNIVDKHTQDCSLYLWANLPNLEDELEHVTVQQVPQYIPEQYVTEEWADNDTLSCCSISFLDYLQSKCEYNTLRVIDFAHDRYWNVSPVGVLEGDARMIIDLYNDHVDNNE